MEKAKSSLSAVLEEEGGIALEKAKSPSSVLEEEGGIALEKAKSPSSVLEEEGGIALEKTKSPSSVLEEEGGIALEKAKSPSSVLEEEDGIAFCKILAARNLLENKIVYVPKVRDKGYPTIMYAGVENMIRMIGKRLKNVAVLPSDNFSGFSNQSLNEHFRLVMNDLHKANRAKHQEFIEWDESHTCGLVPINIWDIGLNKVPNYVLSCLAGHLYNSHVWMFLDLLRDVDHLYEVPDIPNNRYDKSRNDKEVITRWRSRIRYFLRLAKLASKKDESSRQNVCASKKDESSRQNVCASKRMKAAVRMCVTYLLATRGLKKSKAI